MVMAFFAIDDRLWLITRALLLILAGLLRAAGSGLTRLQLGWLAGLRLALVRLLERLLLTLLHGLLCFLLLTALGFRVSLLERIDKFFGGR